ncbi:MAG TPA: glycosyltransferase [Candidatus Coprousia avicola]|nr:glycosyltransferase [Candidatus Coprousia avicola]
MSIESPIRVLQVVPSMNHGGIEHFLMNLYRAIDKTRVQFDFMYRVPYQCVFDSEILSLGGRIIRCVDPDRHPLKASRFYRRFFVEHPEIRVIHEHRSGCDGFFGAMRAARRCNIPVRILHSHSSRKGWRHNPIKDVTDAINAPRLDSFANAFIACSDVAADYLYGRCSRATSECVIRPNAIDICSFAFSLESRAKVRQLLNIPEDALVIGHVGRFVSEKNQSFLLDVALALRANGVPAELLFLGGGVTQAEVKQKAENLNIANSVHFAGVQEDMSPYYSAMDVFCMPSLFEGLPVSCVEAQANGLPMVLSAGISQMADICGHTTYMDLSMGAVNWGKAVCKVANEGRSDNYQELRSAGYDIAVAAREFEALYLNGAFV